LDKQVVPSTLDTRNIYAILGVITGIQDTQTTLNTGHTYGTITDTMEIITTGKKGKHLNTPERYYIYKANREDIHIDTHNPIFQVIHELYTE
jgi:ABC-type transport system involved in Fe-S cluster assembly fused permease/ATPase subunit